MITTYEKIILENLHPHSLVILPETAIPLVPESAQQAFENIDITLKRNDATAIIGTLSKSGNDTFNSAVSIGKDYSVTRKNRLVAFGESTPNIPFLKSIGSNFGFPMSDLKENKVANKPLNFNNNKVAIFICFEIGFPNEVSERASDADILVVMSDNIWFGNSNASYQHRQISQFYAIMYAKPVLFVNNSGLSSVISANGEILQEIPDHKKAIIDYNLKF